MTAIVQSDNVFTYDTDKRKFDLGAPLQVKYHNYTVPLSSPPAPSPFQPQATPGIHLVHLYAEPTPGTPKAMRVRPNLSFIFEEKRISKNKLEGLPLAEWALTHGLVADFVKEMNKLAEEPKEKDTPTVANYRLIHPKINAALEPPDTKSPWVKRLKDAADFKAETTDHYYALHPDLAKKADVRSRLDQLEHAFKTFYYWHALNGKVLPLPTHKLVVVFALDESEPTLQDFRTVADGGEARLASRHEDGFFARREGILYLSLNSREPNFEKLSEFVNNRLKPPKLQTALTPEQVLENDRRKIGSLTPEYYAMCLATKAVEANAERLAVCHFGSRQLAYAAGLLPRYVAAPEWIQYGLGSFFETPLGSPWYTPTAVSTAHLKPCLEILDKRGTDVGDVLKKVVTDDYYCQADAASEDDTPAAVVKAQALAWGLTYYLLQKEPARFAAYRAELDKMPRDLPLDGDVVLGCFARAVDAVDAQGKVDAVRLKRWAEAWKEHLKQEKSNDALEVVAELNTMVRRYQDLFKPKP